MKKIAAKASQAHNQNVRTREKNHILLILQHV
jgi:hypothetical protein